MGELYSKTGKKAQFKPIKHQNQRINRTNRTKMAKISTKTFKKALINSGGNQARIAQRLEVGRSTVHDFINKNPQMRKLLNNEAEQILDIAEDNIDSHIATHKDVDSSKWKLLHSKGGRARGYGQKTEVELSGNIQTLTKEERESEIKRLLGK